MNITLSLVGQMITFTVLVWFTVRFVWPPLIRAIEARQQHIAEGLAAAEQGKVTLDQARQEVTTLLREAQYKASETIEQANRRAVQIIETAKIEAKEEGKRLIAAAEEAINQEKRCAREQLRKEVATLVIDCASHILQHQVDEAANKSYLDNVISAWH